MNQPCVNIPSFLLSFPSRPPQCTEKSSLCDTLGSDQLHVLYTAVGICQSQPRNLSHLPFPLLVFICLFSTSESLFLLCKKIHLYHFLRFFFTHKKYANNFRAYLHHLSSIMSQTKSYCLYKQIHY